MQSDQHLFPHKVVAPPVNEVGNNDLHIPVSPAFGVVSPPRVKHLMPFHGVEFQPSEVCPRNYIIFDQTQHRSQVLFHPASAHKFSASGLNIHATCIQDTFETKDAHIGEREISSYSKEDSDDIDALLSMEDYELEESDEEEISTARTYGNYGSASPDSCSNYGSKPRKNRSSSSNQKSSGSNNSCNSERKRQKMKKMVKALRGIVPDSNQMSTAAVLDEAVRYLKSLKVEVQKLGGAQNQCCSND